jgi:hypothetical protein
LGESLEPFEPTSKNSLQALARRVEAFPGRTRAEHGSHNKQMKRMASPRPYLHRSLDGAETFVECNETARDSIVRIPPISR